MHRSSKEPPKPHGTKYSRLPAGSSISIYKGRVEIEHDGTVIPLTGTIRLAWDRVPAITFDFVDSGPESSEKITGTRVVNLHVPGAVTPVSILCLRFSETRGREARSDYFGVLLDQLLIGQEHSASYLLFHIANYLDTLGSFVGESGPRKSSSWRGRFVLENEEWRITIDKCRNHAEKFKRLREEGGFAITHVGRVERIDGSEFERSDFEPLREQLIHLVSFTAGRVVEPVIESGYSKRGKKLWESWEPPKTVRWEASTTWFNQIAPSALGRFWPTFTNRLSDKVWVNH